MHIVIYGIAVLPPTIALVASSPRMKNPHAPSMAAKCGLAFRSEHTRNSFECGDLVLVPAPIAPPSPPLLFVPSTTAMGIVVVVFSSGDNDQFADVTTERDVHWGGEESR